MTVKTDRLVTLFGGGGFVGRYVAQALFKAGARVRIAEREPRRAFYLRPLTGLGMIQFLRADIRNPAEVAAAVRDSNSVINLVGILSGDFESVHVDGARNIASASAAAGVEALVHVSAIGADPESLSRYGRSKGEGEQVVRSEFPDATIIRPSIVFGMEDNFVNRFAGMARLLPALPVIRGGWKMQPVYAADLGRAIAESALHAQSHRGRTYELGGPQVISMGEMNRWICQATGRSKPVIEIPDSIGGFLARTTGWLPGSPISWDQWLMLQRDNVVSTGGTGFEPFGIRPAPLAAVAEGWLSSYRRQGRFARVQSPY
jgi:uncharacterized protein YbjT (DUF2867 family)